VDPNLATAQFQYTLTTSAIEGDTLLAFCAFRPWESCSGGQVLLKVEVKGSAPKEQETDENTEEFHL
jgi:hypothetical protein